MRARFRRYAFDIRGAAGGERDARSPRGKLPHKRQSEAGRAARECHAKSLKIDVRLHYQCSFNQCRSLLQVQVNLKSRANRAFVHAWTAF
jgi:hypothetical protein